MNRRRDWPYIALIALALGYYGAQFAAALLRGR